MATGLQEAASSAAKANAAVGEARVPLQQLDSVPATLSGGNGTIGGALSSARVITQHDDDMMGGDGRLGGDDFCASQAVAASDDFPCSQPAAPAPAPPIARFTPVPADAVDAAAPIELHCSAGARVQLGREVPAHALPADVSVAFLTSRHDIGMSRDQDTLRFDGAGIVLEPLKRAGFPTYLNGALIDEATTSVVLAHGDLMGFGGAGPTPSADTVSFRADLSALGVPSRMAPPPPVQSRPQSVAAANSGERADDAAVGAKRARGERGGHGRNAKQPRPTEDAPPSATSLPPAPAATTTAEDAVRLERVALVEGLHGDPKRFALRMLEQLANARGRLLDAIDEARSEQDPAASLDALERVARGPSGWLSNLADDVEHTARRIRRDRDLARERHAQHDARQGQHGSAAVHGQRVVHIEAGSSKGGGGKGGGGRGGGGKGSGGKGGGGKGRGGKGRSKGGGWAGGKGGRGRN